MRDQLIDLLYGGLYEASPGSDRYLEQCRRVDAAVKHMEEEMDRPKHPAKPKENEKPESFRTKIVKKGHGDQDGESTNGV